MSEEQDTYREYWENVERIGADAIQEAIEFSDDAQDAIDAVTQQIDESVDGSYWVIYTHAAAKGLIHSDNEDAIFDEGIGMEGVDSYSDAMTKMMYFALNRDVWDRMPSDWEEQIEAHFEEEDE